MSVNSDVVAFARARLNSQVGDGECWTLAEMALADSGGRTSSDYARIGPNTDYIWGTQVASESALTAGDILQFRNFSFEVRRDEPDGSWTTQNGRMPHHTAIVESINEHGMVTVLHQNTHRTKRVRRDTIYLSSQDFVDHGTQVTVTTEGRVWLYHPVARTPQVQ